jgi:hypothetical protein
MIDQTLHHDSREDEDSGENDVVLHLREPLLLDLIGRCRTVETLCDLQQAITALSMRLVDPHDDLHAPQGDDQTVQFSRIYLTEELSQIAEAQTLERARYYVDRLIKSISEVRFSSINDINLNRWKTYADIQTDSLWLIDRRDSHGGHTADYWGNFVPQIPHQMMRRYTRPGDWVLDTFAGSGTTLLEGLRLGRNTLGIELQPRMVEHTRQLVAAVPNEHGVVAEVQLGDSTVCDLRGLLRRYGRETVELAIMHPPYFDIIKFSDDPHDLSNAASVDEFIALIGRAVDNVATVLPRGRYLILVVGDKYSRGDWIPLGFQTMNVVMERGFALKSIVVKNVEGTTGKRNQKELWRYRALAGGFYIFKHEYIFVFRKQR